MNVLVIAYGVVRSRRSGHLSVRVAVDRRGQYRLVRSSLGHAPSHIWGEGGRTERPRPHPFLDKELNHADHAEG